MKQQGKEWITPEGTMTSQKYLPDYVKHSERIASRVADVMVGIEAALQKQKSQINELCMEMLRRYRAQNPEQKDIKSFSFYSFDKEFKIQVDINGDKNYIRCYQATKQNPKHNEYVLINTDFNKSGIVDTIPTGAVILPMAIDPQKSFDSLEAAIENPAQQQIDFEEEDIIAKHNKFH